MLISQRNSQKAILFLYFQVLEGHCTVAPKNRLRCIFSTYCSWKKTRLGVKRVEFWFNL